MKIYIGNKEIAGYFARLKEGFDKIGVKADLWYLSENKYFKGRSNMLARLSQHLFPFFKKHLFSFLFPLAILAAVAALLIRIMIFVHSLLRYDVFILNRHPFFFNYAELAFLKLFRKKVIFAFMGTESRPGYISGKLINGKYNSSGKMDLKRCYRNAKKQYRWVRRIEKYADFIINHPPTALFQQKPFIAWLHLGFPNEKVVPLKEKRDELSDTVKVLHAPTHSLSKGSAKIMEIISRMRSEDLPVELIKLENVPNEKVMDELIKCDLVVDQLYSDTPLAGLGTEAAFARKPVIVGGYYANVIGKDYPSDVIPPSDFCLPEEIALKIKELVLNSQKREEHAQRLNKFVTEKWDSVTIAQKYLAIINGETPEEWIFNPKNIRYYMGYGIEKQNLKSFLKEYVSEFGEEALFIDDKPELKAEIISFIHS